MHGGTRPKMVQLVRQIFTLSRLAVVCDEGHEHEKFGPQKETGGEWCFDTAKEAEHPRELCTKVAAAAVELATSKGIFVVDRSGPSNVPSSSSSRSRFSSPLPAFERPPEGSPEARWCQSSAEL